MSSTEAKSGSTHMKHIVASLAQTIKSIPWSLAEFRHNSIPQSPHENYFKVCRQFIKKSEVS